MQALGTHFERLLKNIQPPPDRVSLAQELPEQVRDFLTTQQDLLTITPHTRLVGSYAQHLSVGDVKDVDILVRVDGDPEQNEPEATKVVRALGSALRGLHEALDFGEESIDVSTARRSVHVYFADQDFHLDIVPCVAASGFDEVLYVPDKGFNDWIKSHPCGYVRLISDLNTEHSHKVRPLIKLLKHFRNIQMKQRRPKSYWLGALVIHHLRRENGLDLSNPLPVVFRDLLNAIYNQYASLLPRSDGATPNIPDPLLGHNVSWNWQRSHFETFMKRVDDGRSWASEALENNQGRDEAIRLWQRIFGADYFPSDVADEISEQASLGLPGRAAVTTSGLIVPGTASGLKTPTMKTTFHGTPPS
jgi:hypothetical protein